VLTRADALAAWLMDNDLGEDVVVGTRFSFRDRPRAFWDGACAVQFVAAEALVRLVWRWNTRQGALASTVTFALAPVNDGGTRLTFWRAGLVGIGGLCMKLGVTKGWIGMVARAIPFVVDSVVAGRVPTRDETRRVRLGQ
jgi:uncharacterized protein YndB with AHSA1/START domain